MKEFDWKLQYAPHGYRYMRTWISFETLTFAKSPAEVLKLTLERLQFKMEHEIEGRFLPIVFTRITVYPKDVGESLNHLDPLLPRLGIEVELRQPAARRRTAHCID